MAECAYISCSDKVIKPSDGRVEVRAFDVPQESQKNFKAKWQSGGEAVFHAKCWDAMKKSAKDKTLVDVEANMMKEATKTAEYHDSDERFKQEAARIGKLIRNAKFCVAFTGAGISTAAGIGDFRGKDGKWTERDKKKEHGAKGQKKGASRGYSKKDLRPTYTHEALLKLVDLGILKYVISQNTDGLHRLSGIPASKISELHGNSFEEKCEKCSARYEKKSSYSVAEKNNVPPKKCEKCRLNHRTGRICERKGCGGYLMNTIINFGDYLETEVLSKAEENAKKADLVLCLGTTLQVSPANSLVEMGQKPTRLLLCNRQVTPYDAQCYEQDADGVPLGSRLYGDCDRLMKLVMKELLETDLLKEWEEGQDSRMEEYNKRRA